jgi:beta-glucanase (GH16 family)
MMINKNWISLAVVLIVGLACKKGSSPTPNLPNISINDVTQPEGNGGTVNMDFTVSLDAATSQDVTVSVTTKDGFGKAGEDYQAYNQLLTFKAGERSKKVTISVVADDIKEGEDDFLVTLTNAQNGSISDGFGQGLISNDDSKIPVSTEGYTSPTSYPGMQLVWGEEFNGNTLNTNDWNYDLGDGCGDNNCNWGNNELQYYTDGQNLYFSGGNMIIEARKETKGGKNYTSTRLTTMGKKSFKYGRIDLRAKLPRGQGIWPAFWMLGNNYRGTPQVGWPGCGEIDIMEFLGHEETKVHSTIHYKAGTGARNNTAFINTTSPLPNEYHVFSLEWRQDYMRMLVDDKEIATFTPLTQAGADHPFNNPFFFLVNLAVGGNWPGAPNATTYFPQWYFIDYIRVFQ